MKNIRVLDLSRVLAGPYCSMLLGDYGADVIKVERPGTGDDTRAWGPPFCGGESTYFLAVNRNKRSITVDLKTSGGQQIIRDLAAQSDVLIENFLPGTTAEFGLSAAALRAENPRLIFCSLTGFGQTGPDADQPGFDAAIQARGGLMSVTGEAGGPPTITGISVIDLFAGLHALNAILAALVAREKTGAGCVVDMALLDSAVNILSHQGTSYLMTGKVPTRRGNSHNNIVPYQTFRTADGYINISAGNDKLWGALCRALKLDALAANPRFATNALRVEHRGELVPLLEKEIAPRASAELLAELKAAGVPASPVNDFAGVFADPQVVARQMIAEMQHPRAGMLKVPAAPGMIDGAKPPVRRPPPLLGEHTAEVLRERLAFSDEKIAALKKSQVI